MARFKKSVTQRDWGFGEFREDFLERDDTDAQNQSARKVRNMRLLASGAVTTRPGSLYLCDVPDARRMYEARPTSGGDQGIIPIAGGFKILGTDGQPEKSITGAPWSANDLSEIWVKPFGDEVLIGSRNIKPHVLTLDDCALAPFLFAKGSDGETDQPYYNFNSGTTIQPSASNGSVTITASNPIFTADYVGTSIRYNGAEIQVTGYNSPTEITGTVVQETPPTYAVVVTDTEPYAIGDAVEGSDSSATGIISAIDSVANTLIILMDDTFNEFQDDEDLIGPNTPANGPPKVVSATIVSPAASANWDEQVFSAWRGWPGYAEFHQNRLVFIDIPSLPNAFMLSVAGNYNSFLVGSADGDAIFETYGDNISNRHLFAISAEDLIIFSEESVSYISTRNGEPITPTNIEPRRFTSIGSSPIEPVLMDQSVAYVSKAGNRVIGAVLSGDVQRYWTTIHISEYAPHLIRNPIRIGSTEGDSDRSERYLFCVNSDGTLAVMRWQKAPFQERIGWVLWETKGSFVDINSMFNSIHGIVDRDGVRGIERFDEGIYVDGCAVYGSLSEVPAPTSGLSIWANNRFLGVYDENDIASQCYPDAWGPFQVGCAFEQSLHVWPKEVEDTRRLGFVRQRNGRAAISVQNSTSYLYNGQRRPHYNAGEDITSPPVERTEVHKFMNFGRSDHPEHKITKPEPGPLTVLAFNVEVTG